MIEFSVISQIQELEHLSQIARMFVHQKVYKLLKESYFGKGLGVIMIRINFLDFNNVPTIGVLGLDTNRLHKY